MSTLKANLCFVSAQPGPSGSASPDAFYMPSRRNAVHKAWTWVLPYIRRCNRKMEKNSAAMRLSKRYRSYFKDLYFRCYYISLYRYKMFVCCINIKGQFMFYYCAKKKARLAATTEEQQPQTTTAIPSNHQRRWT